MGGNGGHWTIIPYKPRSHSLTRSVCRCAIITMMAGPTIHIIHNFFLTLTLTKQNKMLSIVSVDHGNNIIVCRPSRVRERADETHPCVRSDIIYTDSETVYRSQREIPHYDSTCKCCNFPNVYQL